jgi:hypothetical protein
MELPEGEGVKQLPLYPELCPFPRRDTPPVTPAKNNIDLWLPNHSEMELEKAH